MYWMIIPFAIAALIFFIAGCASNGVPMRFDPKTNPSSASSWYIEGKATGGATISCSFVEFDERGDFLDFAQHTDCRTRIEALADNGPLMLVMYCHGWKHNSQSGDVTKFNAFLAKLADSHELAGIRVHGVYLAWRGNAFRPYVDAEGPFFQESKKIYGGESIVNKAEQRGAAWTGVVQENLSYWNRRNAAEHLVSGLPLARAIFTYAGNAKDFGKKKDNLVFVMGHSFGALMLEQSLGHAMTGALTMIWGQTRESGFPLKMPFDFVLFVNSAAPAIYAKEMRDFLLAHRRALGIDHNPAQDMPVIVSLTSTADLATKYAHMVGNLGAPWSPSLQRKYTTGIFELQNGQEQHEDVRQSKFYTSTPGHHPLLINHWIVREKDGRLPPEKEPAAAFTANLARDDGIILTSELKEKNRKAAVWRLTNRPPQPFPAGHEPAMQDSNYWIVSCDKELIGGHNDVWSTTTMEVYAALFRAVQIRGEPKNS